MLAPRFTLRTGLLGLTLGAVVAIVFGQALERRPWAIGVSAALGMVVLSLLIQAAAFALSLFLSRGQAEGET